MFHLSHSGCQHKFTFQQDRKVHHASESPSQSPAPSPGKKHASNHTRGRLTPDEQRGIELDTIEARLPAFLEKFGLDGNHQVPLENAEGGFFTADLNAALLDRVGALKDKLRYRKPVGEAATELHEVIAAVLPVEKHAEAYEALNTIAKEVGKGTRGAMHV